MLSSLLSKFLLLCPKGTTRIPVPTSNAIHFLSTISSRSISTTPEQHSFTVSYLRNNRGFTPEAALKISKFVQFDTAQKPDAVIAFFRNYGFSDSVINRIIRIGPNILTCDPKRRILPKFDFLRSKGASNSDIVNLVNRNPRMLYPSLQNNIIPSFESVRRFFESDKKTIDSIISCKWFIGNDRVAPNLRFLLDLGVDEANISYLLHRRLSVFLGSDFKSAVNEVKEMGFDPSKRNFAIALLAKVCIPKSRWDSKVNALKGWGWSEELILNVFRKAPLIMLSSEDKINKVMRFWVHQLGWNSLDLVKKPDMFGLSLEKRIIPRASVLQYLHAKGLRRKSASLVTPFGIPEVEFLGKFVKCYKEHSYQLLKLYQEKMSV